MSIAQDITRQLGGDWCGHYGLVPGPGHSKRDRSVKVSDAPDRSEGVLVHSFAGEDWRAIKAAWEGEGLITRDHRGWMGVNAEYQAKAREDDQSSRTRRKDGALRLWAESVSPDVPILRQYFHLRGLPAELPPGVAGDVIRFHKACPFGKNEAKETIYHPAMIALYRDLRTNEPCGIHRTALTRDGQKIGRMMLGQSDYAAVKLTPDEEVTHSLAVGEGIETCLTIMATGWRPIWAMTTAGGIERLPVLRGIAELTIFSDTDENERGIRAAKVCRSRWRDEEREVTVYGA